jgi:hypothetical protein
MHGRPTPFDVVFGDLAETDFPQIRRGLESAGIDARDRDAFLLRGEAGAVIQQLRPDDGMGEGIAELAALTHHAFLLWRAGAMTLPLEKAAVAELLARAPEPVAPDDQLVPEAFYVQFPPRLIWAELAPGEPHEPLDGCFVVGSGGGAIAVLGVFGLHPDRMGFTVAEAVGTPPSGLARADGSALFAPAMDGGAAAGLYSIVGLEELLELGARARAAARRASEAAGPAVQR